MNPSNKCPNCGQYKIQKMSAFKWIIIAIGVSAIFIITLPLEIILIPAAIIAAFVPSLRANYQWCRNCKWTSKAQATAA